MTINRSVEKVVAHVGDLPAMPAVVSEVLDLTDDPAVSMARLSTLIQRDPALTAKILRVSNSPYYGMRQFVGTLKLALVILGVREVRNIVMGISVFDTLSNDHTRLLLADDLWDHSLAVAGLAKKLGMTMALALQGEDFIGGLLHDVGKMILCSSLGEKYAELYRITKPRPQEIFEYENDELGFNHADAAAALAMRWNLPMALRDALYLHHAMDNRPIDEAKDPRLAAVVRIANLAARHDFGAAEETPCPACGDLEAWAVLESAQNPIPPDARYATLKRLVTEQWVAPEADV